VTVEDIQILARKLATYARHLGEGMRSRVHRDPDIADYIPEFERLIANALCPKAYEQGIAKGLNMARDLHQDATKWRKGEE